MKELCNPAGSHELIANVMRRFSQMYDSDDGRMFVPLLLEDREPKLDWPTDSLNFVYEYPVLPAGLIPSFIAKMHRFHDKEITPWRKGCILRVQGCRVRVLGDKKLRQVQISVVDGQGSQRRDALDQVRFKFEELHVGMTGLNSLKELIPVPGYPDAPMLNYRFLRTLEDKGEAHVQAPIDAQASAAEPVSIADALGSVRGAKMKAREEEISHRLGTGNMFIEEYYEGGKKVNHDHSIGKGSININTQYGRTLTNCTNRIQRQAPPDRKELLEQLDHEVRELIETLTEDQKGAAVKNYDAFAMEAVSANPDRKWYSVSTAGLLEASKWTKDFTGNIAGTLLNLGKKIWGVDYELPKVE
jgi:internalin A